MKAFDTYSHINELKKAGFKEEQAAVIIRSLMDSRETDFANLATKEQVANLERTMVTKTQLAEAITDVKDQISDVRSELKTEIAELKTELKADIAEVRAEIAEVKTELKAEIAELKTELKADIAELRTEIKDLQINLIKWMIGLMVAFSGIIFAGIQLLN